MENVGLTLKLSLPDPPPDQRHPAMRAYLFTPSGALVASRAVSAGAVQLEASPTAAYRAIVGPDLVVDGAAPADLVAQLTRAGAVGADVAPGQTQIALSIPQRILIGWHIVRVDIHGTVVKVLNPGRSPLQYAPITTGVVQIFRIDFLGTLRGLSLAALHTLRDQLVIRAAAALPSVATLLQSLDGDPLRLAIFSQRQALQPYFCGLLDEYSYAWSTIDDRVPIQPDGTFSYTFVFYALFGFPPAYPDLYFEVVQNIEGAEQEISDPPISCSTYFGYNGTQSVDIVVDDPSAIASPPQPPWTGYEYVWASGIGNFEMSRIDGLFTWGGGAGTINGIDAFPWAWGGTLSLQIIFSAGIGTTTARYYRWSYQVDGTGPFIPLNAAVSHRYQELIITGPLPTDFTIRTVPVALGPLAPSTIASGAVDLYMIPNTTPANTFPWIDIVDPADRPFGYFDTTLAFPVGTSGKCTVKLEIFDAGGNPVPCANPRHNPTIGTGNQFSFVLPEQGGGVGSYAPAPPTNIDDDGNLVFTVLVDNSPSSAVLYPVQVSGNTADTDCGFVIFNHPTDPVTIPFVAFQPQNHLHWGLTVSRGYHGAVVTNVADTSYGSPGSPVNVIDPNTGTLPTVIKLLDTCPRAAFALNLSCTARIDSGYDRQAQYDGYATAAFALSPT